VAATSTGISSLSVIKDGVQVISSDQASKAAYLRRNGLALTFYTQSDEDVYDGVNWALSKYKQAAYRVPMIMLDAAANNLVWPAALGVEQGDVVKVIRRPVGGPAYTVLGIVSRIEIEVGPDKWDVMMSISPYSIEANVLQLGAAGFNTLGSNAVGW
jgi:hypothetical protein